MMEIIYCDNGWPWVPPDVYKKDSPQDKPQIQPQLETPGRKGKEAIDRVVIDGNTDKVDCRVPKRDVSEGGIVIRF